MRLLFAVLLLGMLAAPAAQAATITGSEILEIPSGQTGSGNGTLDLRLFTFSGSEIGNASGGSDFDNGNNTLPQGGGADTSFFDESYITTAGERPGKPQPLRRRHQRRAGRHRPGLHGRVHHRQPRPRARRQPARELPG